MTHVLLRQIDYHYWFRTWDFGVKEVESNCVQTEEGSFIHPPYWARVARLERWWCERKTGQPEPKKTVLQEFNTDHKDRNQNESH